MVVILGLLLATERNKKIAIAPFRQLGFNIGFSPAQHVRFDTLMQFVEVAISNRPPTLVHVVILAIKSEQGTQQRRIEKSHQRKQLVNAVFDWGPGKHEG